MSELRDLIRDILAEELAAIRGELGAGSTRETVRIENSEDLTGFALNLLDRACDPQFVAALRDGRHRFVLDALSPAPVTALRRDEPRCSTPAPSPMPLVTITPAAIPELTKSLITERDIAQIAQDQTRIRVGRNSRLTPLASDEARRRKIRIERMPS
ncbi:MAG TPA: hypothetical protein VLZ56_10360 [Mycoplana sp.]|nr:hypothetical protein [Mycoplana sp.]